jgi:TonB family protein
MVDQVVMAVLVAHLHLTPQLPVSQQAPTSQAQTPAETPWPPVGVSRPGGSVKPPRVIKDVKPGYTREAMREKIQGTVQMEAVIRADGTVGEVRVIRSLDRDFGLDNQAVASLKQWQFSPGTNEGVAAPVLVQVEMTFTLRKSPQRP